MAMLDATTVLERYPLGCSVYDARGRRLEMVLACDPTTGEAVMYGHMHPFLHWIGDRLYASRFKYRLTWFYRAAAPRRHGFWPAPLTLIPQDTEDA